MAEPLTPAQRAARYRRRHPDRVREAATRRNRLRVWVGRYYVGYAPTPEHAESLNNEAREEFHDR